MRTFVATLLALLLLAPGASQAQDGYGQQLCTAHMPPGTPCACVGPILQGEFSEEELAPLLQFLRAFMEGLGGDTAAHQKTIDQIAAEHGKANIEAWLKRFEALSPQTAETCMFKF
jgi:hypothetical protein